MTATPDPRILVGDCLDRLRDLPDCSIDAIVTDPPYELGFMGKHWDASGIAYNVELWQQCLRVLKPGGHLLAFGGTRTYHRMVVAIEDSGFEIRDSIHWMYGSGFPKSLNVSKAITAAETTGGSAPQNLRRARMGDEYEPTGQEDYRAGRAFGNAGVDDDRPTDLTDTAKQWDGWGTALKPAHEPIVVARKPLIGTVAANVLAHGTGALNIDGCRVHMSDTDREAARVPQPSNASPVPKVSGVGRNGQIFEPARGGRWPANIVFTHAADCGDQCAEGCPVAALDQQSGVSTTSSGVLRRNTALGRMNDDNWRPQQQQAQLYGDTGGASRFFTVTEWDVPFRYIAKPGKKERNAGLDGLPLRRGGAEQLDSRWKEGVGEDRQPMNQNIHPTVKPVALMRWLVRLVTPPDGTVLDPFLGSGTTAVAATLEGFQWVGCELTAEYLPIIEGRVAWAAREVAAGHATAPRAKAPTKAAARRPATQPPLFPEAA